MIIYSVNLLLPTNECQQRGSTDYALGVAHNTSHILARVNATLSPQLVGSAFPDHYLDGRVARPLNGIPHEPFLDPQYSI